MISDPLIATGILLIFAFLCAKVANLLSLPRVSGYLTAGILFSPSLFHIFSKRIVHQDLQVITDIALGVIAYSIGGSLDYRRLKHLGRSILWITHSQVFASFLVTTILLALTLPLLTELPAQRTHMLKGVWPMALILGAISAATAPGAVLAIISELRAKGPFTSTLLGVIALDDALTIVLYAIAGTIAHSLLNPGHVPWFQMLITPVEEILLSLLLGSFGGMLIILLSKAFDRRESLSMIVLGVILIMAGFSIGFNLSPLLTNMTVGFVIVNMARGHHNFFLATQHIEEAIFGLFFALAGAHIDLGMIKAAGLLAIALLLYRIAGKQVGTTIGAKIAKAPKNVAKYMGLSLFPQAGVTVGLVLAAQEILPPDLGGIVLNAVIASVIINELIAPPLVKFSLQRAGEVPYKS